LKAQTDSFSIQLHKERETVFMFGKIIEGTVTLVMAFLILANADNFGTAAKAAGGVYVDAVKALQGR
jgi:hypothetical protein